MLGGDPVSSTDADRHDDISHNGSYRFGDFADSAETGNLGDVISEGTNVDLFTEACSLGLCFEGLDIVSDLSVGPFTCPFRLERHWLVDIWPSTEFQAQFCGGEALATGSFLLLGQILRSVAEAAGVIAVVAK